MAVVKTNPWRTRERKACDAVARCLEAMADQVRSDAYSPEDAAQGRSEIDYVFQLGNIKFAFEHTVIEAFHGQLEADAHFKRFIEPIEAALDYQLPSTGYFVLLFPINPTSRMSPSEVVALQNNVVGWVKSAAKELSDEVAAASFPIRRRRMQPTRSMPDYDITLSFNEDLLGIMGSRLMASRMAPRNYNQLRVDRIKRAVDDKLPKLAKWKRELAQTVLVLENRDMALTNHWEISASLELALQSRSDVPDEVWLVDGVHASQWTTICLRKADVIFPHDDAPVRYRHFKESELAIF